MPAKHIDIRQCQNYRWTYHDSVGSDKREGKIFYTDEYDGWTGRCPRKGSEHPDIGGLYLKDRDAKRIEGGLVEVELDYESHEVTTSETGENPRKKRYSIEHTVSEQPLLTHPRYKDFSDEEFLALQMMINGQIEKPDGSLWEDDITEGERQNEAKQKVKSGITSYLKPGIIYVQRYSDSNLESVEDEMVGYIHEAPGSPPASEGKNYLYLGYSADDTDDGRYHNIERRWQQSDSKGWDAELYTKP
jgi:hypothetical protein